MEGKKSNDAYEAATEDGVLGLLGRKIAPLGEIIEAYPISEGGSADRKYKVHFYGYDGAYLLRLFDGFSFDLRRAEFEALHRMQAMTVHCSRPIAFGQWKSDGVFFLLLSYVEGTDAERILPLTPKPQQLRIGMQAGEELSRIGCCAAPEPAEAWAVRHHRRIERAEAVLQAGGAWGASAEVASAKVRADSGLAEGRPESFLHGSFGPANLIVHTGRLVGVIGFERFGWGDPVYEFARLGLHSRSLSPLFCTGQILGYHGGQAPDDLFWRLYALYAASGVLSQLADTLEQRPEMFGETLQMADRLLLDHDGFASDRPSWFAAL